MLDETEYEEKKKYFCILLLLSIPSLKSFVWQIKTACRRNLRVYSPWKKLIYLLGMCGQDDVQHEIHTFAIILYINKQSQKSLIFLRL